MLGDFLGIGQQFRRQCGVFFRRHATAGRLAEMFGEDAVETDEVVRTLGWRRVAQKELTLLKPATRDLLDAYAEGVNAYLADRPLSEISLEYALLDLSGLDYHPESWTAVDSIASLCRLPARSLGQPAIEKDCELLDGRPISEAAIKRFRHSSVYRRLVLQERLGDHASLFEEQIPSTHNSFNASSYAVPLGGGSVQYAPSLTNQDPNQVYSITEQLQMGIRGLEIDVIATAMRAGMRASELAGLELAYAPPFGSAKDPVNMLGYIAQNIRDGERSIQWHELEAARAAGARLLDVRAAGQLAEGAIPGAEWVPVEDLRARVHEFRGERVVVHCRVGQGAHTAGRLLAAHGVDVVNLDGGYLTWRDAHRALALTDAQPTEGAA